jgi:hypothetical protein
VIPDAPRRVAIVSQVPRMAPGCAEFVLGAGREPGLPNDDCADAPIRLVETEPAVADR